MPDFQLVDNKHNVVARITHRGELVVAPISYSTAYYSAIDSTAVQEIVVGQAGKRFVITGLLLASNKTFGTPTIAETVTLYEANPADLDTNLKTVVKLDMLPNDRMPATGLNLITEATSSIVGLVTDDSIDATVAGYYVDIEEDEFDTT